MGKESDKKSSNPSKLEPLEELEPNQKELMELDARDMIEPLAQKSDNTNDHQQHDELGAPEGVTIAEQEIALDEVAEITFDEVDRQIASDPGNVETEVLLDQNDVQTSGPLDLDDVPEQESNETAIPLEEEPDDPQVEDEVVSDEIPSDEEPDADSELSEFEEQPAEDSQNLPTVDKDENDFVTLDDVDDDKIDDGIDEKRAKEEIFVTGTEENEDVGENLSETSKAEDKKLADLNGAGKEEKNLKTTAKSQNGKISNRGSLSSKKVVIAALIVLMISGIIIYATLSLIGIKGKVETVPEAKSQTREPAEPAQIQAQMPKPPGKYDKYLAKLKEAEGLRNDLLQKKEEIYKLKLYYRNGIVELTDQISHEMQKAPISSFAQALKNKRIELNLRTIQRRQAYIQELEKPNQWVHNGSEELLFLKRKALLGLQIAEIASGIDLDRHMRYVNAAIQKYQPSAEKLTVDNYTSNFTPLETIWSQIQNQQVEKAQNPVSHKDEKIIAEICSGDFKRIAELSNMTARAAKCLSQMNGSDLFLNGLKQLAPDEAKYLSQWPGNWICLNSVNTLSPSVARYLFKWEGSWISLNGLTEFPPELTLYLMEWKGNQLELMGLNYHKKKPDQRALKYLALWETMGGKLFVSEGVRKEMERVM